MLDNAKIKISILLTFAVFSHPSSASAGEIITKNDGTLNYGYFTGSVARGDAGRVENFFRIHPEIKILRLLSPGGDAAEGIRMAEVISLYKINTVIGPDDHCASACAIAFMGGKHRIFSAQGKIGIHYPYREFERDSFSIFDQKRLMESDTYRLEFRKKIHSLAVRQGINTRLVDMMFHYEYADRVYYIDPTTGIDLGLFTEIMP